MDLGFLDAFERNKSACDCAASVTLKGTKHINLHENCCVHEEHQNGKVKINHIPGVINGSNLFTKELKTTLTSVAAATRSWFQNPTSINSESLPITHGFP